MLKNHFKSAYRHLLKNKFFSLIHICGLAVALSACALILQYLSYELGYDQFHENKDELYRVTSRQYENGQLKKASAETAYGAGDFLKQHFPEVQNVVRFYKWPASTGVLMMAEGKIYNERNYFFAQPAFFEVFSSLLVQGDPSTCLSDPNSIVVSEGLALKMFGTRDAIGKSVKNLDHKHEELIVTGIMEDIPDNSHFDLDVVRPWDKEWTPTQEHYWTDSWWTYLTIRKGTDIPRLEKRLNVALTKSQQNNPDYKGISLSLQSIKDIHLNSHLQGEIKANGDRAIIFIMGSAFVMILIIAWINYVNLETARFSTRMKEVGLRRIVGSSKGELVLQFFVQYLFINIIGLLLSCLLVYCALPFYTFATGIPIHGFQLTMSSLWTIAVGIFFLGTFVTGIYPALSILKFNPIALLKHKSIKNSSGLFQRKSLLVVQFISSLTLIAFLLVVAQQLDFMRRLNRNINLSQILTVYNPTNYSAYEDSLRQERNTEFRNKLLSHPGVQNLTTSSAIPGEPVGFTYVDLAKRSLADADKQIPYKVIYVDYDFLSVFGLKLKAGRNYSRDSGKDNNDLSLIVTESTARELGFTSAEEAVDKEIYFMEDAWDKWKIIGVVEDYRHESVKSPVYPTIFRLHRNKGQMVYYSVLLNAGIDPTEGITTVEKAWKDTWPEKPFEYFFLDAYYDQQFKSEIHFRRIFASFSFIAIFIACLGILGMTLFEANQRLKEISIRKVLGASVGSLLVLLTRGYFGVVGVSTLVSIPVIYFLCRKWLETYPIHVGVTWMIFILPLTCVVLLILIASAHQTIKAARTNPVENLKCE